MTYYNFVSDQLMGYHGILIPGTLRDSLYLLEGVLDQQSNLDPNQIITDTAGASDVIHGLFWLLGYQFTPRYAKSTSIKLWSMDKSADYGELNDMSNNLIDTKKIVALWEDFLRVTGSLSTHTITASELLRGLLNSKRPSALTKALRELGRIIKTMHLLKYFGDED